MIDNDGNLTSAGVFSVMSLVMAPVVLAITLAKLFFRAPLAAILGTAFCVLIAWIGVALANSIVLGMNPLGALLVMGLMLCFGAGLAYAIASTGWLQKFFGWECSVLEVALLRGGVLGRIFYVVIQVLPGLLLACLAVMALLDPNELSNDAGSIIVWLIMAWLLLSQITVLRFHRTEHPVGRHVTFTGAFLENANTEISAASE